ncbi:Rha family transcriptional regulator [Brevibacillus thermoruber]|uniref:Rha family transcriptional regulator n=1 Tax=Brevibacillus thermoruber TaxID=33942 RepID=UPI00054F4C91|nr:Rha family transcriptional regulator [Brevibacillus thermoruber]
MRNPKRLTPFGLEVKKRLLELGMTQQAFCEKYEIPYKRFSEILYGDRPGKKYRGKIAEILKIAS